MEPHMPDIILDRPGETDPEHEALLADSVGVALLVVLDTLSASSGWPSSSTRSSRCPSTRSHRSSSALPRRPASWPAGPGAGSRASRPCPTSTWSASARSSTRSWPPARDGDFEALLAVLDPDVVVRADQGAVPTQKSAPPVWQAEVRGAEPVASRAMLFAQLGLLTCPALVNGVAGAVTTRDGVAVSVGAFTVRGGKVVALDILADPDRLRTLDLTILDA